MFSFTHRQELELTVNHDRRRLIPRPADTLLYSLRNELGLTGAKPGCENGDCGACTVIVDGLPLKSCMVLTAEMVGHEILTVESLNNTALQDAFIDEWAFQCGYCTSGFLMNAQALITQQPDADTETMVDWMRANICRCTGYAEISRAVQTTLDRANADPPSVP